MDMTCLKYRPPFNSIQSSYEQTSFLTKYIYIYNFNLLLSSTKILLVFYKISFLIFRSVVAVVFQNTFQLDMYQNNIF
jgi:hypothetical protein